VARLGVHSCSRLERGSDGAALPCARVDGLEPMKNHAPPRQVGRPSFWRPSRALPDPEKPCRGAMPSRPRPVGGVNELVKYADIDVRSRRANNLDMTIVEITGGMLRAARVPVDLSFEVLAGSHVDELPIQRVERERLRRACRRHHARQHHECRRRAGRLAMNVDARLRVSRGPDADARLRCDARGCYGGLCQEGGASNEKKAPGVPGFQGNRS
jgi:hypothetical protein